MTDLIDRQTAIDAVHYEWDLCLNFDGSGTEIANYTEKALCDVPSADTDLGDFSDKLWRAAYERGKADAVRHGHWLRTGRTNVYGGFEVECSVCNDNVMITNIEYEHYCRNCGARMDERSE